MRPATLSLEINLRASSCDGLDLTLGLVDTGAFVADLTNSHTVIVPTTKGIRRDLCAGARAIDGGKGIEKLVLQLNRLFGVKLP